LEPTKRLRVVQQTIGEQMEVVNKEDRKQEGLKKLAQVSLANFGCNDVTFEFRARQTIRQQKKSSNS